MRPRRRLRRSPGRPGSGDVANRVKSTSSGRCRPLFVSRRAAGPPGEGSRPRARATRRDEERGISLQERIAELAAPLARDADVEVLDVEVKGGGAQRLVRVIVDRKGGVTIDACQRLSQRLSVALDEQDPIEGRYQLEVTSPGTDYPLTGRAAFDRVEGRAVLVHHDSGDGKVRQVRGTVVGADDDAVVLDVDGEQRRLPYAEIVKAAQALPW